MWYDSPQVMKQKALLLVSLAAAVLAAFLARAWLDARNREVEAMKERIRRSQSVVRVVGLARALPAGTTVRLDDLRDMPVLAGLATSDHVPVDDLLHVVGRRLVHTADAGAPLLWSYLDGGRDAVRGLADDVRSGLRAVSIPVSGAAAVSGLVRPNDHVDVLGSFVLPGTGGAEGGESLVTMTVLQNATVLATGSETARSAARTGGSGGYSTVTLPATPREAEVLVFAQQMRGKLFLTLRNPADVHYETDLPRVDFSKIEAELSSLNEYRQKTLRRPGAARGQ